MTDAVRKDQRFNIDTFRSELHEYGVHQASHFNLVIHEIPPLLRDSNSSQLFSSINEYLVLRVDTAKIPGVSLATQEVVRHGFGAQELKPYAPIFDRIDITAYDDRYGLVYDFFQSWMKLVYNYDLRDSINGAQGFGQRQNAYELTYKEDHAVDVSVIAYNPNGEQITKVTMREAFPTFLQSINMDWNAQNQIVKVAVSFAFTDWYQEKDYKNIDPLSVTSTDLNVVNTTTSPTQVNPQTPVGAGTNTNVFRPRSGPNS